MSTGIIILVIMILLFLSIFMYFRKRNDTTGSVSPKTKAGTTRAPDGVGEGGNNQLEKMIGVNGEEQ
jgi:hypothetical protein